MALEQVAVPEQSDLSTFGFRAADIASPALRALYSYWDEKWQGRRMPTRADIEPLEIPTLLPIVYLVDVERDPLRFRFRLVGTRIVAWFGRDTTGSYVDESSVCRYRDVLACRLSAYDRLLMPELQGRHRHYERLIMPLAGRDGTIGMLLGGLHPTRVPVQPSLP